VKEASLIECDNVWAPAIFIPQVRMSLISISQLARVNTYRRSLVPHVVYTSMEVLLLPGMKTTEFIF
jgi:hypothetical protein